MTNAAPIDVMIVDDSATVRRMVMRGIETDAAIRVAGSAANGAEALLLLKTLSPAIVLLDVDMPVMNGLEALPKILAAKPGTRVLMASALTRAHAGMSLKALELGAADYVPKPDAKDGQKGVDAFFEELRAKIKAHAFAKAAPASRAPAPRVNVKKIVPTAVAIGSSTGGPPALLKVFTQARGKIRTPVFVTQHMPATFTALLAEQLGQASGAPAREGADGVVVQAGTIYVAPGGKHMEIFRNGVDVMIRLSDAPPEHFCKPAVDPMLRSLAKTYGPGLLAAILTGMGRDGAEGCIATANAGGNVLAQDEATSVVYGMPAAAQATGRTLAQLPLDDMAAYLAEAMRGGR